MRDQTPQPTETIRTRTSLRSRPLTAAVSGTVLVALVAALSGPRAHVVERWTAVRIDGDPGRWVAAAESGVPGLDAAEAKTVVWADTAARERTPVALVYLHGFSADRHEVDPLVQTVGARLGANVFFTRLAGHGLGIDAMGSASAEAWLDDAAEAMQVGRALGDRVVLIGTSTGATLAVWAASRPEADGLAGLVLISPNFQPAAHSARMLLWPWGGAIARIVVGPERCFEPLNEAQSRHWTTCYPTRALLPMMALVEHVRTADLGAVQVPALVFYSRTDRVVDARETERLVPTFGAPARLVEVADAGDPAGHILAGEIISPTTTGRLADEIVAFIDALMTGSAAR